MGQVIRMIATNGLLHNPLNWDRTVFNGRELFQVLRKIEPPVTMTAQPAFLALREALQAASFIILP
jgi:hypothetical protein